jgi:hypothetical protein
MRHREGFLLLVMHTAGKRTINEDLKKIQEQQMTVAVYQTRGTRMTVISRLIP